MSARMLVAAWLALIVSPLANAQVPPPAPTSTTPQTTAPQPPAAAGDEGAEVRRRLVAIETLGDSVSKRLTTIEAQTTDVQQRIRTIDATLAGQKEPTIFATLLPAFIAAVAAVLGVFLGGYINDRQQRERLKQEMAIADSKAEHERNLATGKAQQERELAAKQAKLQIGGAVVEWQLKQLSLLYGPMRALLGQSLGLYRQMNQALAQADSSRFKFADVAPDVDGKVFQIQTLPGTWERFRTVMHISEVYGRGFGVETYFDEIVSIGGRIEKIIQEHAGYARHEQKDLMNVFAQYLAHFAILKHLHEEAKAKRTAGQVADKHPVALPESTPAKLKVDVSAAFPQEIHVLVNQGFDAITKDIEEWRAKAIA